MSDDNAKVKAIIDGFVGLDGVPLLVSAGDEYDPDHPLVVARPDLFSAPPQRPMFSRSKPKAGDA